MVRRLLNDQSRSNSNLGSRVLRILNGSTVSQAARSALDEKSGERAEPTPDPGIDGKSGQLAEGIYAPGFRSFWSEEE
jgi:hypothetical protein